MVSVLARWPAAPDPKYSGGDVRRICKVSSGHIGRVQSFRSSASSCLALALQQLASGRAVIVDNQSFRSSGSGKAAACSLCLHAHIPAGVLGPMPASRPEAET